MILGTSGAIAATTSPTAKPSVKATAKPVLKKPVVKKPVVKRRPIYRRKPVGVTPSPAPRWSPKGFYKNGEVYVRTPSTTELLGVLSASPTLTKQFKACSKYACGVVQVASISGCTWWEITATFGSPSITDPAGITYGSIRTTAAVSHPKQILTILLISTQVLKTNVIVRDVHISCYHSPRTETVPSTTYSPYRPTPTPVPSPTPSPTPTPTDSPTDSPTPTVLATSTN